MKVIDLTNLRTGIINNGFVTWYNGITQRWEDVCLDFKWESEFEWDRE